jgi:hypothetical protein
LHEQQKCRSNIEKMGTINCASYAFVHVLLGFDGSMLCFLADAQPERQAGDERRALLEVCGQECDGPVPDTRDRRWRYLLDASDRIGLRGVEEGLEPLGGAGPVDFDERGGAKVL